MCRGKVSDTLCTVEQGKSSESCLAAGAEYSSQPSEGSREEEHHPVKQWYEAAQKAAPSQRRYPRAISGREEWWKNGQEALARAVERQRLNMGVAKNIIIFIGDGMGVSTVSAARIFEGYERDDGVPGEQNLLSFEKFPFTGLAKVSPSNSCCKLLSLLTPFASRHTMLTGKCRTRQALQQPSCVASNPDSTWWPWMNQPSNSCAPPRKVQRWTPSSTGLRLQVMSLGLTNEARLKSMALTPQGSPLV